MVSREETELLARYRVDDGTTSHYVRAMSKEQIIARRAYIRSILRMSAYWSKADNRRLDHIRLYKMGEYYVIEDMDYRNYVLTIDRRQT